MKYIIKGDGTQVVPSAQDVPRRTAKVYMSIQKGNKK
jgi:hypothetical protein